MTAMSLYSSNLTLKVQFLLKEASVCSGNERSLLALKAAS